MTSDPRIRVKYSHFTRGKGRVYPVLHELGVTQGHSGIQPFLVSARHRVDAKNKGILAQNGRQRQGQSGRLEKSFTSKEMRSGCLRPTEADEL